MEQEPTDVMLLEPAHRHPRPTCRRRPRRRPLAAGAGPWPARRRGGGRRRRCCGGRRRRAALQRRQQQQHRDAPRPVAASPAVEGPVDVRQVLAKVEPAVVTIRTEVPQVQDLLSPTTVQGAGTGFVVDPNGTVVTNNHVVEGAQTIQVTFSDGTDKPATVVGPRRHRRSRRPARRRQRSARRDPRELRGAAGRGSRRGHRQRARPRRRPHGHGGHRLGARPDHLDRQRWEPPPRDPDRRRHQPGQLRRAARRRQGRGRRDRHRRRRRRPEHRVRHRHHPVAAHHPTARDRHARRPTPSSASRPPTSTPPSTASSVSAPTPGPSSWPSPPAAPPRTPACSRAT